jgi:hypothetical protein
VEGRRVEVFRRLISKAMSLLKTEEFKQLEASIKRSALEQLGLDPTSDEIDLFFTPLDTVDFYKSLDLVVGENGFTISATEVGEGVQNAIVLSVLRAFEEIHRRGRHSTDRRTRNVPASPDAEVALPDTQDSARLTRSSIPPTHLTSSLSPNTEKFSSCVRVVAVPTSLSRS